MPRSDNNKTKNADTATPAINLIFIEPRERRRIRGKGRGPGGGASSGRMDLAYGRLRLSQSAFLPIGFSAGRETQVSRPTAMTG